MQPARRKEQRDPRGRVSLQRECDRQRHRGPENGIRQDPALLSQFSDAGIETAAVPDERDQRAV